MSGSAPATHPYPRDARLHAVAALRATLWEAGFRPVPVYNADSLRTTSPGKAPMGEDWGNAARRSPPSAVLADPHPEALNTGILSDGLRPIDIDVDNPTIAASIRTKVLAALGEAPMRMRPGSPRCLLLYRAAEGAPRKRVVSGPFGKVEVLGVGQQFVAFGQHPSGGELTWAPETPGEITCDALPGITEAQLDSLLADCARSLGGAGEKRGGREGDTERSGSWHGLRADSLQVLTALHAIANDGAPDWEFWNKIGMAIWAATGGSEAGRAAFHAWSEMHPAYDATETDRRWDHYATSPPTRLGAGTLFHMARAAEGAPDDTARDLIQDLTAETILGLFVPQPVRLLGDLVTSTTRAFIVGPTGLGKTMLGMAVSVGAASGEGFLHWRSDCPVRVLYVDGEMPIDQLQVRIRKAVQDHGDIVLKNLLAYTRDREEELEARYLELGKLEPLNGEDGQRFMLRLIDKVKPELVVFDNVQCLLEGVQKEEEVWIGVLPLVQAITARRIGQVWIDHTARSTGFQYGTSVKSWRFDVVATMTALPDEEAAGLPRGELAFSLTFTKARRRAPENWEQFEPQVIHCSPEGEWTTTAKGRSPKRATLSSRLRAFYDAFLDAMVACPIRPGETTREAWLSECIRTGLIDKGPQEENGSQRNRRETRFRNAVHELREAGYIGVDGDRIMRRF